MPVFPPSASTSLQLSGKAYVSLGAAGGLQESFTVEVWICPRNLDRFQWILTQGDDDASRSFQIFLDLQGFVGVRYGIGNDVISSPKEIAAGSWTYLAVTYDAPSRWLVLYVDGFYAARRKVAVAEPLKKESVLVGAVASGGKATGFLQGNIGRVALWSAVRDAGQVLADGSNSGVLNPIAESALEAYFDFSNPPATDQSGMATPLRYLNGAQLEIALPGLMLDGSSYADVGQLDFAGDASFTIEGWFFAAGYGTLVGRAVPGAVEYRVQLASPAAGLVVVEFTRGATTLRSAALPGSAWYHFAAVHDAKDQVLNLYVDGNLQASLIDSGVAPGAATPTLLGASAGAGSPGSFLTGTIQNIRFWSVALLQRQIRQWLYNQPVTDPQLLGSFDFSVSPPVDTTDRNTIALEANAAVATRTIALDPGSKEAVVGSLTSLNADYLNQVEVDPDAPPTVLLVAPQPELWSEEHREASWQGILDNLPADAAPERRADLRRRFEEGYATAERRFRENPELAQVYSIRIENGIEKLIHHGPHGDVLLYEGAPGAVSPCTLWWIDFVYLLTYGFLSAIGLAPAPFGVAKSVARRIYNLVIANAVVVAGMNLLVGETITVTAALGFVRLLHRQKLLWPVIKFALTSLGWWSLVWLLKQCIAILTGFEAAAVLAGFIGWAAQLSLVSLRFNSSCGTRCTLAA